MLKILCYKELSFFINYLGKGEYKTATVEELQNIPTRRIITIHILVLLIFAGALFIRNQIVAVAIFVIIKIVIDAFLHLEEHAKKLNV